MKEFQKIKDFEDILGQEESKKQLKSALMIRRNIILVGPPGVGKTTLAKNVSKINKKGKFIRVQGSPDLNVEDLIGDIDPIKALKHGPTSLEAFTPGKIFKADKGVLFFDEINRCPEKLQNSLLQALEEKKVTIGNYDIDFDADFIFIGSMNPEDFAGTEKLSEVLLDRFDMIYMSYPETLDLEKQIINLKGNKLEVEFPDDLLTQAVLFVRLLRENKDLERVPSVRASLGLYERAQSNAILNNKKKVDIEDVKEAIISVIAHRIKLKPSVKYLTNSNKFIEKELSDFLDKKQDPRQTDKSGDLP
ncbi:MAG: MoxR family ATPase [Candidatus Nanoarchaeia archaeon]|jgi:MoxR-like ATPase|nr:MoxR family ATPase [Candidatus Nanoarchaeia archaeon]|tara:strand:- start:64704 stop:65618 length:915 start_codon:yes stop_codon:yes gene_type:complete